MRNDPLRKSFKGARELLRTGTPIRFEDKMIEFDDFNTRVGPPSISRRGAALLRGRRGYAAAGITTLLTR